MRRGGEGEGGENFLLVRVGEHRVRRGGEEDEEQRRLGGDGGSLVVVVVGCERGEVRY